MGNYKEVEGGGKSGSIRGFSGVIWGPGEGGGLGFVMETEGFCYLCGTLLDLLLLGKLTHKNTLSCEKIF